MNSFVETAFMLSCVHAATMQHRKPKISSDNVWNGFLKLFFVRCMQHTCSDCSAQRRSMLLSLERNLSYLT